MQGGARRRCAGGWGGRGRRGGRARALGSPVNLTAVSSPSPWVPDAIRIASVPGLLVCVLPPSRACRQLRVPPLVHPVCYSLHRACTHYYRLPGRTVPPVRQVLPRATCVFYASLGPRFSLYQPHLFSRACCLLRRSLCCVRSPLDVCSRSVWSFSPRGVVARRRPAARCDARRARVYHLHVRVGALCLTCVARVL